MTAWHDWKTLIESEKEEIKAKFPNIDYEKMIYHFYDDEWHFWDLRETEKELEEEEKRKNENKSQL